MNLTASFLLVALAGGLGAVIRYGLSLIPAVFPVGILIANAVGSFIAGLVIAGNLDASWLVVGLAGGVSTFSTFAAQTHELFQSKKTLAALANLGLNLLVPAGCFLTAAILL